MTVLDNILKDFSPYDFNHDETYEINSLTALDSLCPQKPLNDNDKLLLVIINSKLLELQPKNQVSNLLNALETFRLDLEKDGYNPRLIIADVYSGPRHQDGLTVLAIRKFFQEIRKHYPYFKGAIFIGSFPEAFLVRTYPWRKHAGFGKDGVVINGHKIEDKDYLRIWPDILARRSDIVLCDLDGNWDKIYIEAKTKLHSLMAAPFDSVDSKNWAEHGSTSILGSQIENWNPDLEMYEENVGDKTEFEDFFHINDGEFSISQGKVRLEFLGKELIYRFLNISNKRNLELSAGDLGNPNPIATPKIILSRIDAKHIAIIPNPLYRGDNGESLLDKGDPQEITAKTVYWDQLYVRNSDLECRLIVEYLGRNHDHRKNIRAGTSEEKIRYDAIAGPEFTKIDAMKSILGPLCSYTGIEDPPDGACLSEYVQWLRKSTLIRVITTHANSQEFHFRNWVADKEALAKLLGSPSINIAELLVAALKTAAAIEQEDKDLDYFLGNRPERWFWDKQKSKLCSGWKNHNGIADLHIHKALWKSGMKYAWGRFYISEGCDVNSPWGSDFFAYDHDRYGEGQIAESLLFYTGGLAIIARAKTFNDLPKNIANIFERQRRPFGEIWSEYFNSEKQDASLYNVENGIGCKRSYSWGLIGDWTLKIEYSDKRPN
jgi:hypothetical protein